MISTATTATVATITTTVGIAATLGLMAVLVLIGSLIIKELASAGDHPRLQLAARFLNISVAPLLLVFAAAVVANIAQVV
jgi:Na+-driven multidrug efflux pump